MSSIELPPCSPQPIVIYGFMQFVIGGIYLDPSCSSPLGIFFLLNATNCFLTMIVMCFQECSRISQQSRDNLNSLYLALFGPVALGIATSGAIWWFFNEIPRCRSSICALLWIVLTMFVHLPFTCVAYDKFQTWWDFYKNGPLESVPYHPKRDLNDMVQKESMGHKEAEEDKEENEISAGLLEADREQQERDQKKKQADCVRNVTREKTCPICYVDFEIGEKVVDIPNCLHTFHEECVAAWFEKSYTCPMCRGTVRRTGRGPRANRSDGQDLENGIDWGDRH